MQKASEDQTEMVKHAMTDNTFNAYWLAILLSKEDLYFFMYFCISLV